MVLGKIKQIVRKNKDDLITYGLLVIAGILIAFVLAGFIWLGYYYNNTSTEKTYVQEQPVVSNAEIPVVITSMTSSTGMPLLIVGRLE